MPLRELARLCDEILLERLKTVLPELMAETNTDMWIVIGDEYNEGPTVRSLLPSSFFQARRRALFVFARTDTGRVARYIVSRPDFTIDRFYDPVLLKPPGFDFETFYRTFATNYDIEAIRAMETEDTRQRLARLVRDHDPRTIAIETSSATAFADGLSKSNYDLLMEALGETYGGRTVSSETLTIRWLESRTDREIELFASVVAKTREIIAEVYSTEVISPGKTTLGEARFAMMERGHRLGMVPWFDATVWARRAGAPHIDDDDAVILPGDLLHCDVGFRYGTLCSDVQEMAYVDNPESPDNGRVIARLQEIHRTATRLREITAQAFREGATGNEVLAEALHTARTEGIERPMIYSHATGIFGHGPGPTIGQFGNQTFVEGSGEYRIRDRTCYALELNVREAVPAWDDLVIMYGQEIGIVFRDGAVEYPAGRQSTLHIIG